MSMNLFSSRSQRSLVEEEKLRDGLRVLDSRIADCRKRIERIKEAITRIAERESHGQVGSGDLDSWLEAKRNELERLKVFNTQRASMRSKLDSLIHPSPSQQAARQKQQTLLARLAGERLAKDGQIGTKLSELRTLLQERQNFTDRMQEAARQIDLSLGKDGLDVSRYENLFSALPEELPSAKSAQWVAWFTGAGRKDVKAHVAPQRLVLPETLAHSGIYEAGEKVFLTAEEAAKVFPPPAPPKPSPRVRLLPDEGDVVMFR